MVGEVVVLTLNRPQNRNALSVELLQALGDAVQRPGNDRAFLLTGAGGAFSAGADLAEGKVGGDFFKEFFALVRELRTSALPMIAYVNGPAIGAGMMSTMACDLRVGATESYYLVPVADMAIGVDEWVVGSLSSLDGASRARLMLLAGATPGAEEAAACGYALTGGKKTPSSLPP